MELRRYARPWLALPAVFAAAAVVLVACGGAASGGTTAPAAPAGRAASGAVATDKVLIANSAFSPQTITVSAGTTVTWTNKDPMSHDVTSANGPGTGATTTGLFASGEFTQGQTFSYTFAKAGTYYYECTIHATQPAMHGTVIVK
jgi:plastocyanin